MASGLHLHRRGHVYQFRRAVPLLERARAAGLTLPDRATDDHVLLAREVLRGMIALYETNAARELGDYAGSRLPPGPTPDAAANAPGLRLARLPFSQVFACMLQEKGLSQRCAEEQSSATCAMRRHCSSRSSATGPLPRSPGPTSGISATRWRACRPCAASPSTAACPHRTPSRATLIRKVRRNLLDWVRVRLYRKPYGNVYDIA